MSQLTIALGEAQADTVGGRAGSREAVSRGVEAVAQIDRRVGEDLRTSQRWGTLRGMIDALPRAAGPATYTAYTEVTDALRALYRVVWSNGQFPSEPGVDAYFLADAAAAEVPQTLIAAGQVADQVILLANRSAAELPTALALLASAQAALVEAGADLSEDLQSAVDGNPSGTLSASILSRLDRFRRSVDTLAGAANVDPRRPNVDADQIGKARVEVHTTGTELHTAILRELDALVVARDDRLATQQQLTLGAIALAALLAVIPSIVVLLGRRRRAAGNDRTFGDSPSLIQPGPAGEFGRHGELVSELSLPRREHSSAR